MVQKRCEVVWDECKRLLFVNLMGRSGMVFLYIFEDIFFSCNVTVVIFVRSNVRDKARGRRRVQHNRVVSSCWISLIIVKLFRRHGYYLKKKWKNGECFDVDFQTLLTNMREKCGNTYSRSLSIVKGWCWCGLSWWSEDEECLVSISSWK